MWPEVGPSLSVRPSVSVAGGAAESECGRGVCGRV